MQTLARHELAFLEGLHLAHRYSRPAIIYDVGANVGQFAVACKEIWPDSMVHCFEPSAGAFSQLDRNTRPWADSITLRNVGLWSRKEERTLCLGSEDDESASMFERWLPEIGRLHPRRQSVRVVPLDEVIDGVVDLLKIDAEGAEFEVLRGARGHLRPDRIHNIYFEFNSCALDARTYFRDFWLLLRGSGYNLFQVMSDGTTVPIQDYHTDLEDFTAHREFLAS